MSVERCKINGRTDVHVSARVSSTRRLRRAASWMVVVSLQVMCLPGHGFGEEPAGQEFHRPWRAFGEVSSWQNQQGLDRLPTVDKLLLGMPLRRAGLTPRVNVTEEYTDNAFFSSDRRSTDWITKISPGVGYITSGAKGQLSVDYSFDSRIYAKNGSENTAFSRHNGELWGLWNVSSRTVVTLFDRFESFQDPTEQTVPGVLTTFGRTSINVGSLGVTHRLTPAIDIIASYGNFVWMVDRPGVVGSMTHEGELGVRLRGTARSRTTASYRVRQFDFSEGKDFQSQAAYVTQEWEVSETLSLSGAIGGVYVGPNPGLVEPLARASVKFSIKNVTMETGYFRDVFPPSGGISQPLVSDFVRASTKVRIANGVLLDGAVGWILTNSTKDDVELRTLRFGVGVSYAPTSWLAMRFGYDRVQQREEFSTTDGDRLANKVSFRVTATY